MDFERTFDLLVHMRKNPGEDYTFDKKKNIVLSHKAQAFVLHKSIQAFFQGVGVMEGDKIIQAFSGSSDLPTLTKDVFNVIQTVPNFDTFWQLAFKGVKLKKGQLSWEIADVASGLMFELIPEGEKVKFYGVSGNVVDAKINKYGAGIGVTWEMIEGNKLYQFVDLMGQVKAKLNDLWSDIHYGLLGTAAATNPIAYQLAGTDPILDRDIATINKGYETIGAACKDKGYGDTANAPMVMYCSPSLKARINQAMRVTTSEIVRSIGHGQMVEYNVAAKYTWNSNVPTDKALMCIPGFKTQNAVYLQELGLSEQDIATLSEMRTYWSAFGAIVADTDQFVELAFA